VKEDSVYFSCHFF